jgi:hypothetical protein
VLHDHAGSDSRLLQLPGRAKLWEGWIQERRAARGWAVAGNRVCWHLREVRKNVEKVDGPMDRL